MEYGSQNSPMETVSLAFYRLFNLLEEKPGVTSTPRSSGFLVGLKRAQNLGRCNFEPALFKQSHRLASRTAVWLCVRNFFKLAFVATR